MIRRPPRSTLFPYTTALPILYGGAVKTVDPEVSGDFAILMQWADEIRELKVRANADNPKDAAQALSFGAEGIGLDRKSTRLNSSHANISYAVFCLKKKKDTTC